MVYDTFALLLAAADCPNGNGLTVDSAVGSWTNKFDNNNDVIDFDILRGNGWGTGSCSGGCGSAGCVNNFCAALGVSPYSSTTTFSALLTSAAVPNGNNLNEDSPVGSWTTKFNNNADVIDFDELRTTGWDYTGCSGGCTTAICNNNFCAALGVGPYTSITTFSALLTSAAVPNGNGLTEDSPVGSWTQKFERFSEDIDFDELRTTGWDYNGCSAGCGGVGCVNNFCTALGNPYTSITTFSALLASAAVPNGNGLDEDSTISQWTTKFDNNANVIDFDALRNTGWDYTGCSAGCGSATCNNNFCAALGNPAYINYLEYSEIFDSSAAQALNGYGGVQNIRQFAIMAGEDIRATGRKCLGRSRPGCSEQLAKLTAVVDSLIFKNAGKQCNCKNFGNTCTWAGMPARPQICRDLVDSISIFSDQSSGNVIKQVPLSHALVGGFIDNSDDEHLDAFIDRVHYKTCSNKMVLGMFQVQKRVEWLEWNGEDDFSVVMRDLAIYHATSHVMLEFLECVGNYLHTYLDTFVGNA